MDVDGSKAWKCVSACNKDVESRLPTGFQNALGIRCTVKPIKPDKAVRRHIENAVHRPVVVRTRPFQHHFNALVKPVGSRLGCDVDPNDFVVPKWFYTPTNFEREACLAASLRPEQDCASNHVWRRQACRNGFQQLLATNKWTLWPRDVGAFIGCQAEIFGDDDILTCGSLDAILPICTCFEDPFVVPALTELRIFGTCDLCMIEISEGVVKAIDVACCGIPIELDGLTCYFEHRAGFVLGWLKEFTCLTERYAEAVTLFIKVSIWPQHFRQFVA